MERLEKVCRKLIELKELTGKNDKAAYLEKNKDDEDFKTLLRYRYDIFKAYGIKKMPRISYALEENRKLTLDNYIILLDGLADNNINDTLRKHTVDVLSYGNYEYAEILEGIITKELSLGVDTTVKKFLKLNDISPALASPMKTAHVHLPAIQEKKADGVRCVALVEGGKCLLYTRQGRLLNFPKIEEELVSLSGVEEMMFDLELETEARTGISGICNSNLKTGYTDGSDNLITAVLFDEMPTATFKAKGKTKIQSERTEDLQKRFANFNAKRLKLIESQLVTTHDKMKEINDKYIAGGFEGSIIKDPNAAYPFKRSTCWLKLKAVNSVTLKVVGTELGKGKRAGKIGALVCESACGGIKVNVGSGLNDEDVEMFTKNPPIGKFVEVLFNVLIKGRDSEDYSCFLPRYKEMRVDKEEADTLEKVKKEHIGRIEE